MFLCLLVLSQQAHCFEILSNAPHVAQEVFPGAAPLPHGRTALDAVWELDLDSWDLAVWIQVFELLGDVRNGSVDSAVAALDVLPFEASRINRLLNELLGGLFACLWR
jgi:hypothetical protein